MQHVGQIIKINITNDSQIDTHSRCDNSEEKKCIISAAFWLGITNWIESWENSKTQNENCSVKLKKKIFFTVFFKTVIIIKDKERLGTVPDEGDERNN